MSDQNDNREKLLKCAKREFLEKGYTKASLRKITAEAGLTTGAVYFFFKDKEGLFSAVVEKPLERIIAVLERHNKEEAESDFASYQHVIGDHDDVALDLINAMYEDYDAIMILLHHAAGSAYENITDRFVAMLERDYTEPAKKFEQADSSKHTNSYMLHWLCHVQIDAFVHLLEHEPDKEKAKQHIRPVMDWLVTSWMDLAFTDESAFPHEVC